MERTALIAAYWQHHRDSTSGLRTDRRRAEATRWAADEVDSRVAAGDDDVVELLCALAAAAPDGGALAFLGAGPIESLLIDHATRVGERVEAAARRDERFRAALRCAWFDGAVPADLAARLRRFGPPD